MARGDFTHADVFDPEIVSCTHGVWPEEEAVETHGLAELGAELLGWLQQWEHFTIEAGEFTEAGDRIAVTIRWKGRAKLGGAMMEGGGTDLWTFRDGKAVRLDLYVDHEKALAALRAGAGEGD